MLAAQQLLNKVKMEKPTLVDSIRQLSEAYIELAYCSVSHLRKQQHGTILYTYYINHKETFIVVPIHFPPSCKLVKLSCLNEVAMPTINIKVQPAIV